MGDDVERADVVVAQDGGEERLQRTFRFLGVVDVLQVAQRLADARPREHVDAALVVGAAGDARHRLHRLDERVVVAVDDEQGVRGVFGRRRVDDAHIVLGAAVDRIAEQLDARVGRARAALPGSAIASHRALREKRGFTCTQPKVILSLAVLPNMVVMSPSLLARARVVANTMRTPPRRARRREPNTQFLVVSSRQPFWS